jgi:hypothetical protein
MTPCVNAFMTLTRVLGIAGFALVLVSFWQRRRFEKYLRARKASVNPRKSFWMWVAVGAISFSLQPFFFESCTGFHLPAVVHVLTAVALFAMFIGPMAIMFFVMPKYDARNPPGSIRLSFILLGVAGILFLVGLYFDFLR